MCSVSMVWGGVRYAFCSVSMMWGGVGKPQILKGKSGSTGKSEPKGESEPKIKMEKGNSVPNNKRGKGN